MEKSIYQMICEHITDGILDPDFSLPGGIDDSIPWAPGAQDGVFLYHMPQGSLDDGQEQEMARAVRSAAAGNYPEAEALFAEWTKENRAVSIVDELQQYVMSHQENLPSEQVYRTAKNMILQSRHAECVKIGLEFLELFKISDEETREIIRRIGLYDEFTLFSLWNIRKWETGNQEIFELAKKVNGWGRIHAVEFLNPENEEIRHWLLTEGTFNSVMYSYSGLTCWEKSGAEELLLGHPSKEDYKALGALIEVLLDEGPVSGMTELEHGADYLLRFLMISPDYELDADDYEHIRSIKYWAEDNEHRIPSVAGECEKLLRSPACAAAVMEALEQGQKRAPELAQYLGIPFRAKLLESMQNDFEFHYHQCGYLMDDPAYVEPVLQLFRDNLPLDEMKGDPEDKPFWGNNFLLGNKLLQILMRLADKPLTGADLVKAGLENPAAFCRSGALRVLQMWVRDKNMPLKYLSPELWETVSALQEKEIDANCGKMIASLLAGQAHFPDSAAEEDDEDDKE